MPISVACRSCGCRLNAPDRLAGGKAKCPRCRNVLTVPSAKPKSVSLPPSKERKLPKRRELDPEEQITHLEEVPDEPVTHLDEVPDEPEPVEEVVAAKPVRKRKRKKGKRPAIPSDNPFPTWAWWLISVGGFFLLAGGIALPAILKGHGAEVLFFSVLLAVMIPVSTVILIISMFVSSWLGGGIEFGEAHVVIPKAIGLLFIVNLISLLPFGRFLAAPIWLFGLMFLFGLDLWETRILMAVNWGLNFLAQIAIFAALTAAFMHGSLHVSPTDRSDEPAAVIEEAEAINAIEKLGGDCIEDDDGDGPVVEVSLARTRATDADLARLKSFPKLRKLDLSGTQITDAGLGHLKKLSQLETLILTGTRVTQAGIADLQAGLPRVKIVR